MNKPNALGAATVIDLLALHTAPMSRVDVAGLFESYRENEEIRELIVSHEKLRSQLRGEKMLCALSGNQARFRQLFGGRRDSSHQ